MVRQLIAVSLLIVTSACGGARIQSAPDTAASPSVKTKKPAKKATPDSETETPRAPLAPIDVRVGDVFVHRFSGSYTEEPMMLTEEIAGIDGDLVRVKYELAWEGSDATESLEVTRRVTDWHLVQVFDSTGNELHPGTFATFIARTAFAADHNSGKLDSTEERCMVGDDDFECKTTRFDVSVAGEPATFTVTTSQDLPGHELGAVLKDAAGDVIYRSELIAIQRGAGTSVAQVATELQPAFEPF